MQITINKPGMLGTVQDAGRMRYLHQAVPVCGAMDSLSAALANIACGNDQGDAVIEFTYADIAFTTDTDVLIAYSGDGQTLRVNDLALPQGKAIFIPAGTKVTGTPHLQGCRTYLAIAGGWDVPMIMGSRSTCLAAGFGGYQGRALQKGDAIASMQVMGKVAEKIYATLSGDQIKYTNWSIPREMFVPGSPNKIRVIPGPEFTRFSAASILNFLSKPYRLSADCNRMGYRLDGEKMASMDAAQLISTAVTPGTIQISGDGTPIMLMADCQTTGGYPRIAQVAAADLPLCAQLKPGDEIFFSEISHHEAEMLYIEQQEELRQLQRAIRVKLNITA